MFAEAQPGRMTQVVEQCQTIEKELVALNEVAQRIEHRLELLRVEAPVPPDVDMGSDKKPIPLAPFAQNLAGYAKSISQIRALLEKLDRELEF